MNSNQATFTVMAALCSVAFCQSPPATILTIEMENVVRYNENFATPQKNGTSTAMEAQTVAPATFFPGTLIGDVVTVNGRKSRGAPLGLRSSTPATSRS